MVIINDLICFYSFLIWGLAFSSFLISTKYWDNFKPIILGFSILIIGYILAPILHALLCLWLLG